MAEGYTDYASLIDLTEKKYTDPLERGSKEAGYRDVFGRAYVTELLVHLQEQGEYSRILDMGAGWGDYIRQFLESGKDSSLTWVHALKEHRYKDASTSLQSCIRHPENGQGNDQGLPRGWERERNLLSLAKLSAIAHVIKKSSKSPASMLNRAERATQPFFEALEALAVHQALSKAYHALVDRDSLRELSWAEKVKTWVNSYIQECYAVDKSRGILVKQVYHPILNRFLIENERLTVEEMVDLLSLGPFDFPDTSEVPALLVDTIGHTDVSYKGD